MGTIAWTSVRRRAFVLVLATLAVLAGVAAAGPPQAHAGPAPSHAYSVRTLMATPGRVIVEFRPGSTASSRRSAAADAGARVRHLIPACWLPRGASLAVLTSASESTAQLMERLRRESSVASVEPDATVHLAAVPDDPMWGALWGMRTIRAPRAWDSGVGSPAVVVADIDTGVDYTHEDLAANMWHNPGEIPANGIDDDGNGYVDDVFGIDATTGSGDPMDEEGHGTHTSGTVAAVGDNGIGVVGVAWNARIMALKFTPQGPEGFVSDVLRCIDYILQQKAAGAADVRAVNASWGMFDYSIAMHEAIVALGDAGVVLCAAAGNYALDSDAYPIYPANYQCDNIISVAATCQSDELAFFSSFGRRTIDVAAPGVGVVSTVPGDAYAAGMGTSMATPHVAGAVALLAAQDRPGDTPARVRGRLMGAVVDLGLPLASRGRLDLAAAVLAPTDVRGPRCGVRSATVKRARPGRIWLRDYDVLSPRVTTTLCIATRGGSVRERLRWQGHDSADRWWWTRITTRLPRGVYRMWVTSTDFSGNRASSAEARLRVD